MSGPVRVRAALLAGSVMCGGCGLILGLDEFTDAPVGTGGGGAGQGGGGLGGGGGGFGGNGGEGGGGGAGQGGGGGLGGGEAVWSRIYGDAYQQIPTGVAVDGAGDIFLAGSFQGTIQFGDTTLISAGGSDIFLAKLDGAGNALWSKQFGDATDGQSAHAIAVDTSGNVVIAGSFDGNVKLGATTFVSSGLGDAYVAKFDPSGNHLWSKHLSGPYFEIASAIAIDPQTGDVVVTGSFDGTISFGNGTLSSTGMADRDVFIAKLASTTGISLWRRDYGDNSNQSPNGIATDPAGNIIVGGSFLGVMAFGSTTITNNTNMTDIFLARLDAGGNADWAKRFGTSGADRPGDIARDAAGNIFMTGYSEASIDFGCDPLAYSGGQDAFLVRFDSAGQCTWSDPLGGPGNEKGTALAIDSSGDVIVTGTFTESILVGGETLSAQGHTDIVIAKLSGTGAHRWSKGLGGTGFDNATGTAISPGSDDIILAGETDGSLDCGAGPLTSAGSSDVVLARLAP